MLATDGSEIVLLLPREKMDDRRLADFSISDFRRGGVMDEDLRRDELHDEEGAAQAGERVRGSDKDSWETRGADGCCWAEGRVSGPAIEVVRPQAPAYRD